MSGPLSTANFFSLSVSGDYGVKEIEIIIRHLEIDRVNLMQDSDESLPNFREMRGILKPGA